MHQQYGMVHGNRIQVVSVGVAIFLNTGVVISPADYPLAWFQLLLVDPLTQNALDIGYGTGLAGGFRVKIGSGKLH